MHTENSITIGAPAARIYELGARVEDWPEILPHYRWVTILRRMGSNRRLVEMAATRDGFPVRWVSIQELEPERHTIRYRHVRGLSRGMRVVWTMEPAPAGTLVHIGHDFDPPWPRPLGPLAARYVVGDLFVRNIAGKTLRQIKKLAEDGQTAPDATTGGGELALHAATGEGETAPHAAADRGQGAIGGEEQVIDMGERAMGEGR